MQIFLKKILIVAPLDSELALLRRRLKREKLPLEIQTLVLVDVSPGGGALAFAPLELNDL